MSTSTSSAVNFDLASGESDDAVLGLVLVAIVILFLFILVGLRLCCSLMIDAVILRDGNSLMRTFSNIRRMVCPWCHPRTEPSSVTSSNVGGQVEQGIIEIANTARGAAGIDMDNLLVGMTPDQKKQLLAAILTSKIATESDIDKWKKYVKPDIAIPEGAPSRKVNVSDEKSLSQKHANDNNNALLCPICIHDIAVGDNVLYSCLCDHVFHSDCLSAWLSTHSRICPYCRQEILTYEMLQEAHHIKMDWLKITENDDSDSDHSIESSDDGNDEGELTSTCNDVMYRRAENMSDNISKGKPTATTNWRKRKQSLFLVRFAFVGSLFRLSTNPFQSVNGFISSRAASSSFGHPVLLRGQRKNFPMGITKLYDRNNLDVSASYDTGSLPNMTINETETILPEYIPGSTFFSPLTVSKSSPRQWFRDNIFLGIDPTPDVVSIATIYFVEGALGLARLAQTFLLKDELNLGPAELSALTGFFTLPWTIKPLYGFLSDGFPLWGYRRRPYLILAGLTGCLSYSLVGHDFWGLLETQPDAKIPGTVAALVMSSACIAFSDVVADGIVVQKSRDSNDPKIAGGLQSICWGSAAIGGLVSAYFSGSLLEVMKPQDIFSITAFLPLMVALIALFINEKPVQQNLKHAQQYRVNGDDSFDPSTELLIQPAAPDGIQAQIDALWSAIKQPSIYKPALFLFLWQSTPTCDGAMLFFMTEDLKFGPEFLGRVRLVTAFASLFGVWLYNQYLKTKPIKDILFWSSIISTPLGLLNLLLISHVNRDLGIPDTWFVFGDDVVLSVLGEIAFLPTLVLAARLCPPGVEAVLFATLMSINNGAGTVGTEIGALLTKWLGVTETNFDNLALLSIICNISSLYPLFFIGWLDEVGSVSEQEFEDGEKTDVVIDTPAS